MWTISQLSSILISQIDNMKTILTSNWCVGVAKGPVTTDLLYMYYCCIFDTRCIVVSLVIIPHLHHMCRSCLGCACGFGTWPCEGQVFGLFSIACTVQVWCSHALRTLKYAHRVASRVLKHFVQLLTSRHLLTYWKENTNQYGTRLTAWMAHAWPQHASPVSTGGCST